ncbi:MAG TPA: TolC family protein [Candidatus Angelobacter sp.]|nr:TolC family protein [Candidatus Angelobacter sp.]
MNEVKAKAPRQIMRLCIHRAAWSAAVGAAIIAVGCRGVPTRTERVARQDFHEVAERYRPDGKPPVLPELKPASPFSNYLMYAMLNSPRVQAAYYDWAASVERITVERSLPDPKLTFESDIADVVMTVMPGLMQDFPGPGKLKARGNMAAAVSRTRYSAFEAAVLQSAFELKRSFLELHFLDERLRINRENARLLGNLESIARAQNETGKVTLQDVLRAQLERDRLNNEITNVEDSRRPMLVRFKAALGMPHDRPDPPVPESLESSTSDPDPDELLKTAFARNPRLKAMEGEVRAAQAAIGVATKEKVPDFSLGLMADVQASPTIFRPLASVSLPIWRKKIAAEIAQAEAAELAARSRLTAEQISLTVEFAEKSFMYREINRELALLQNQLIPKAKQSLEIARTGYLSGTIDFFNLIDAERTLLNFGLAEIEARTRREIVLAEMSLMIAGVPPEGAPVLSASNPTLAP